MRKLMQRTEAIKICFIMLTNLYKNKVLILILRNITGILPKISLIFENDSKNIAVTLPQDSYKILETLH